MRIRFWGTRGSLAKPGPSTIRYGGNTSIEAGRVELRCAAIDLGPLIESTARSGR